MSSCVVNTSERRLYLASPLFVEAPIVSREPDRSVDDGGEKQQHAQNSKGRVEQFPLAKGETGNERPISEPNRGENCHGDVSANRPPRSKPIALLEAVEQLFGK